MRVKICGITRLEDALEAAALGVDALGFNFYRGSKRFIAPARAAKIIAALPPFVSTVGIFVNHTAAQIAQIVGVTRISVIQLHGDEPKGFARRLGLPVIRAIRVESAQSVTGLRSLGGAAFLFDAPSAGFGGSGEPFDWALVRKAARRFPVVLAGGLTAENVGRAIRVVRPYGVDVASGVESAPGIKSHSAMARFIRAAREQR